MNKKLLMLGASHGDIPLILAGKELGFKVITTGNNPSDLGHNYSDRYCYGDYSNSEEMLRLSKKLEIDAICATDDCSAITAAYLAEKLNLPGHDSYKTTLKLHHKDKYRKFALKNNIPTPFARSYKNIYNAKKHIKEIDKPQLPLIVKPVDSSGGKGVSKISNKKKADELITEAFSNSPSNRIVIEEFIPGSRHGFSAFLSQGEVKFYFSDNEHYYFNPYRVGAASVPSIVPKVVENKLCAQIEKIASLLSLKDGIFHVQYILKDEEPIIIEVCRRAPGDLYIKFVEYAAGVNYAKWIVKESVGMNIDELGFFGPNGFFTRYCVKSKKTGEIQNVKFDVSIKENIIDKFMWWEKGDIVSDIMKDTFGIVFLEFESKKELLTKTEKLDDLIQVDVY